jgi:purine-binding chemotaxis protein CheW
MEKETESKEEQRQILTFTLSNEEFGLDVSCVREVLLPQKIYPLPQSPEFVEGIIKLREHTIAIIDLKKKLDIKVNESGEKTKSRIVICKIKKFIVGLIVSSVAEVVTLPKEALDPTPAVVSTQVTNGCISGIARISDRVVTLLNLENILTNEEAESLSRTK